MKKIVITFLTTLFFVGYASAESINFSKYYNKLNTPLLMEYNPADPEFWVRACGRPLEQKAEELTSHRQGQMIGGMAGADVGPAGALARLKQRRMELSEALDTYSTKSLNSFFGKKTHHADIFGEALIRDGFDKKDVLKMFYTARKNKMTAVSYLCAQNNHRQRRVERLAREKYLNE